MDEDALLAQEPQPEDAAEPGGVAATETVAGEEGADGMPQLDPSSFDNQIFWLVVALVAIFMILTRVALPRLQAILATRAGTIGNDLQGAQDLRDRVAEAQASYDRALAEARAEAGRIGAQARAGIQADLDAALAEADGRIAAKAAESQTALAEIERDAGVSVEAVARDAARAILEALGGRADDAALDAAVTRRAAA